MIWQDFENPVGFRTKNRQFLYDLVLIKHAFPPGRAIHEEYGSPSILIQVFLKILP